MLPWKKLDSCNVPDGTELSLWRRGDELVVRIGGEDLMSNRQHGSEEQLAEIGCETVSKRPCVLIGGLGLGFTLKATLAALPKQSEIVVGELMPQIVEWVRVHMGSGALLDDRRVRVELGNVADLIRRSTGRFDAILLDVDNGPDALCIKANHVLYGPDGLAAAHRALKPGGRLAIWASSEDPAFVKRFGRSGFDARAVRTRSRRDKGARHVIFVGDALESEARGGDAPASRRPRAR